MKWLRASGFLIPVWLLLLGGPAAFAQLPGDLDGDGEVNLPDAAAFVGCLEGPGVVSADPVCGLADFDPAGGPDADVDLRDFAGFQSRFGFGQGPPQIVSFSPAPGVWVVDAAGLTEVRIGFSEPVVVPVDPTEAVDVWGLVAGTISGFTTSYDADTFVLTVTFAEALRNDQVTVVVDYTIEDVAGNPLDGEITNPKNAALPSGNNINGGQGVFRIRVLQGDANRDGTVDAADQSLIDAALDQCEGDPAYNPLADLNHDGCVDAADQEIVTTALGNQLPETDGVAPFVTSIDLEFPPLDDEIIVRFRFSEQLRGNTLRIGQCFFVGPDGNVLRPWFANLGGFANSAVFAFSSPVKDCDGYTLNLSNVLQDFSGELLLLQGILCP